jgi:hypothetical protein
MLVAMDDRRTLQLVMQATWRLPEQPDTLQRFRFCLDDAVAVGDASLVCRTLESDEWIRRNITHWTWFTAVAYFKGSCDILDLLKSYATPSWTENRFRNQLFRRDLHSQAIELFETVDIACIQWFVDNVGPASLPSQIVGRLDQRLARLLLVLARHEAKSDQGGAPPYSSSRPRPRPTGEPLLTA